MKKVLIILVVALLSATASAAIEKPLGPEEFGSVDELALAIESYFPKVQGEVKEIQGDRVTIGLGKNEGLLPGMLLTLWRDGAEIHHPVTGVVLGRAEENIGTIEIVTAGEGVSTAALIKKVKEPRKGDRARITPKKINLAVVPLRQDKPEVMQALTDRLQELGRFTVFDKDKVAAFLKDKKKKDSALIQAMMEVNHLDAVVAVGIYPADGKSLVSVRIFTAGQSLHS